MDKRKLRTILTTGLLAVALTVSLAPAANAGPQGGDPMTTGCANNAFS